MQPTELRLSALQKTWIFDLDGTLVRHNGYKSGNDEFLPGAKEFLLSIPQCDFIIIMTARENNARTQTEQFLLENKIRYDLLLFEIPMGERIIFNDNKPSGLKMSYAIECVRNVGLENFKVIIDPSL